MSELPFGLARKETFAALSPADLETMGKRAADMFVSSGIPLNDSICKLAKEYPSISTHQVRRVVEHANTETFQRLFEKQASERYVEFPVADPAVVLRSLEAPVLPVAMSPTPSEYGRPPMKLASKDVEQDVLLCQAFGYTPTLDIKPRALTKTASGTTISEEEAKSIAAAAGASLDEFDLDEFRMGIEEEHEHDTDDPVTDVIKGGTQESKVQAAKIAIAHLRKDPKYYSHLKKMEDENEDVKGSVFTAKIGHNLEALKELRYATSLDQIKEKVAGAAGYSEANPFGNLFDLHGRLRSALDGAQEAFERNDALLKEAGEQFTHQAAQHVLGGGTLGEVMTVALTVDPRAELATYAIEKVAGALLKKGFNIAKLQSDTLIGELTKSAAVVNPGHPMVEAYAAMAKLAEGANTLKAAYEETRRMYQEADAMVGRVLANGSKA